MLNEKIIIFTGSENPSFSPQVAGITYTNPNYSKTRKDSPIFVFEYVIEGEGTLYYNGKVYHPKKGDSYILHEHSEHYYYSNKTNPWTKIWFNVKGTLVKHLLKDYGLSDIVLFQNFNNPEPLRQIISSAEKNSDAQNEKIPIMLHQYIQELSKFNSGENSAKNINAIKIKNYIDNNIDKQISLEDISKIVFLSKVQIINIFKDEYGLTPYSYIINEKISFAKRLLLNTTLSINDVADSLNFTDAQYFSNYFKKHTGVPPSKYRKNHGIAHIRELGDIEN